MLILPAFTLDKDEAAAQGGIDVAATEEAAVTEETADAAETADEEADTDKAADTDEKKVQTAGERDETVKDDAGASERGKDSGKSSKESSQSSKGPAPITYEGREFSVEVVDGSAVLPENTELKVKEIDEKKDSKEYKGYYEDALKAVQDDEGGKNVKEFSYAKFYDISLLDGKDKITPDDTVSVKISYDEAVPVENKKNVRIVHFAEDPATGEVTPEVLDNKAVDLTVENKEMTETTFEADSFSVYAVVYTVDFEYTDIEDGDGSEDGNGTETYKFSIEGESSIKLSDLFKVLHVKADAKDAANVEFSDPELIKVTQTEDDWMLESLKPFNTEEKLTVTMEDGKVIEIKVTDENKSGTPDKGFFDDDTGYILYTEVNGVIYVMDTEGTPWRVDDISLLDTMGIEYKWHFEYVYKEQSTGVNYYRVHPLNDNSKVLALNYHHQELVQQNASQIMIIPDGNGYIFEGYNDTRLANNDGWFVGLNNGDYCRMMIYTQEHPETFDFNVTTADSEMGTVSGTDKDGQSISGESFTSITNGSNDNNKTNRYAITAVPNNKYANNPRYLFDHWELDGNPLDKNTYGQTISAGRLTFNHNNSELKAFFVDNPAFDPHIIPDDDKEGTPINKEELQAWLADLKSKQVPLNAEKCKKTAEVYDYENRIYRVDLTSQASLSTFEGTIDLGFIIDVSGSMKFPSKLDKIERMSYVDLGRINDDAGYGRKNWENWGFDRDKEYYVISDETQTSTVVRLYYRGSKWYSIDASYENHAMNGDKPRYAEVTLDNIKTKKGGFRNGPSDVNSNYHYQIYKDGDSGKQRKEYLESSLSGTISEMNSILEILSVANNESDNPDVKVAWNTFCKYLPDGEGQYQHDFISAKDKSAIKMSYAYDGGTSTDIALLDAAGITRDDVHDVHSKDDSNNWKTDANEAGGRTYTENGNGFKWEQSATKYAVLITDGAPQRNAPVAPIYVKEAAKQLKKKGVTLITVGLSMDNVKSGKILLYDIADTGKEGQKLFYSAKSGDELQYVLYEIIRQILKDATVQGNVTDTIDQAFYPVDKATGKPIGDGKMIDLEGNLTSDSSKPHGIVRKNNDGTYKVDWNNQAFTVDGWHGTIYVKAKEDLLGGNAMKTNYGEAKIESHSYTLPGQTNPIPLKNDPDKLETKSVSLTTPRVNVNELQFTHNNNEWTVYLNTEVNPKAELIKMYDNIKVEEVVTKADDKDYDKLPEVISSTGDLRYSLMESVSDQRSAEGNPQIFYLKDLIAKLTNNQIKDGASLDWNKLIADANKPDDQNKGITIPYNQYGLGDGVNDKSNINIKLVKEVIDGETGIETSPHSTTVTGKEVEKYTLSVLYSPDYDVLPVGQGGKSTIDFQTGLFGTKYAGHGTGTEDSNNEHIINVFVKGLQFTKKDEKFEKSLEGAEFKLYKKVGDTETEISDVTRNGAVFTINTIAKPEEGAQYYIKETKAPDGYNLIETPIPVALNITDTYTPKPDGTATDIKPADTVIYDWKQEATVTLGEGYTKLVDKDGKEIGHLDADSVTGMSYYFIMNNPGAVLPQTGGIGTYVIYITGLVLVLGSGAMLIRRRRPSHRG